MKTLKIPFVGTYESLYDADINQQIEQEIEYFFDSLVLDADCQERVQSIIDNIVWKVPASFYKSLLEKVANDYAEYVISEINDNCSTDIKIKKVSVFSPRFYNYSTDEISIDLSDDDYKSLSSKCKNDLSDENIINLVLGDDEKDETDLYAQYSDIGNGYEFIDNENVAVSNKLFVLKNRLIKFCGINEVDQ